MNFLQIINATKKNRKGMIWFVCGVSTLKKEGNVVRLLRSWGGEALYNLHNDDCILSTIGTPCIVKCSLVPKKLQFYMESIGEKLVETFLQKEGINTPNNPQFDTNMKQTLLPEQILKIIQKNNLEFEQLTDYKSWVKKINFKYRNKFIGLIALIL